MNRLHCKPCLAFEALASLIFCNFCRKDIPEITEWVNSTYNGIQISPSNSYFDILISHYTMNEIESLDVEQLVQIYPQYINNNDILEGLRRLEKSHFDKLWKNSILPVLDDQCNKFLSVCESEKVKRLLCDIEKIHEQTIIDDITVYMTYFTSPVSFLPMPNCYLTNAPVNFTLPPQDTLSIFTHELCHKFANQKAISAYIDLISNKDYIKRSYFILSNIVGETGYEEEFVVAIENAIMVKQGLKTYKQAIDRLSCQYKNSIPVAIILFSKLEALDNLPERINDWLYDELKSLINEDRIEAVVNRIIPGYTEKFRSVWNNEKQKYPNRFTIL